MADRSADNRRCRMRAWRRGTREMDLILGPFADAQLSDLPDADLHLFEQLMTENDHDLYQWITARIGVADDGASRDLGPRPYASLLDGIAAHASERLRA
jgi:antitoxin CptB